MDSSICFIVSKAYRSTPSIKDILEDFLNPKTIRYSNMQDAISALNGMFLDDEGAGVFGVSHDVIYSCGEKKGIEIAYYRNPKVVNPIATSDDGVIFWIERHENYIQYFDQQGYLVASFQRLGFIPDSGVELNNQFGKAMLCRGMMYPIGKCHPSVGKKCYVTINGTTFYKSQKFWKEHGTFVEHWNNEDAEFNENGNLISISKDELFA